MSKNKQLNLREDAINEQISMRLDEIIYTFNAKNGNWAMHSLSNMAKGNNVLPNIPLEISKSGPMIENMDLEIRAKLAQNKELEDLKSKIMETKQRVDTINKKISESKETQKLLIEKYIRETLEVERIKEAREKLEKLKKELGAVN